MLETSHTTDRRDTVMDVVEEQIAQVYAEAFLGVANQTDRAAELVEELVSLVEDVLEKFPALEEALGSLLVGHAEKETLLDRIFGNKAAPEVLNFLKVLSAHGRLEILRTVVRSVESQYSKQVGKVEVNVQVAEEMGDALRSEFVQVLRDSIGAEPELRVRIDPSLIAGFVVKVGDTVYDGSIKTRFEHARKAMVARAVEGIETHPESFFNGESR